MIPESCAAFPSREAIHRSPPTRRNEPIGHRVCRTGGAGLDSTRVSFPVGLFGREGRVLDSRNLVSYERNHGIGRAAGRGMKAEERRAAPRRAVREVRPGGGGSLWRVAAGRGGQDIAGRQPRSRCAGDAGCKAPSRHEDVHRGQRGQAADPARSPAQFPRNPGPCSSGRGGPEKAVLGITTAKSDARSDRAVGTSRLPVIADFGPVPEIRPAPPDTIRQTSRRSDRHPAPAPTAKE